MKTDKEAILTFRVETACTFRDTFFKATDEEGGELVQFPSGMILDVPQHFTAVKGGRTSPDAEGNRLLVDMGPDDETEDLRQDYFAAVLPINANPALTEKQRVDETARIKANFLEFGQAEPGEVVVPEVVLKDPEDMTKAELQAELTEKGVEFDPASKKDVLVEAVIEARSNVTDDEAEE